MLKELLGKKIIEIARRKNFTQARLAETLGVSQGYISDVKRGKEFLNLARIEAACAALELDPAQLFAVEYAAEDQPAPGIAEKAPSYGDLVRRQEDQIPGFKELREKLLALPKERRGEVVSHLLNTLKLISGDDGQAKKKAAG